jgi:AhpC/TSA family
MRAATCTAIPVSVRLHGAAMRLGVRFPSMTTILTESAEFTVDAANGLWLAAADAARVTGWTLKPEGMCRDDQCVPLPATAIGRGRVDVEAFWRRLGNPVLCADDQQTWVLGAGAGERNDTLAGLMAPDFTLPDLSGTPRTLSDLRGKKVLLVTWATW